MSWDGDAGVLADQIQAALDGSLDEMELDCITDSQWGDLNASHDFVLLTRAAAAGQAGMVECLLRAGIDAEVRSSDGYTALLMAAREGHLPVVDVLLSSSSGCGDLEARATYVGLTALFLASWKGHVSVVERLLCAGADAEALNDSGETALHVASYEGHLSIVDMLLSSGRCGDIEARDENGWTALGMAAFEDHASVVERLLCAGADPEPKNTGYPTPLLAAIQEGRDDVAELLHEVATIGSDRFRANRIWQRRMLLTLWRVATNYDVMS